MFYSYQDLQADIDRLRERGERVLVLGSSFHKRDIYGIVRGEGEPIALIHGAIHAREHITAKLTLSLCEEYQGSIPILFVPMVNPDGNIIVGGGVDSFDNAAYLKEVNGMSDDFSLWKANGRAVDLNVNFDAGWGQGAQNVRVPSPGNYIGPYPFSEPESRLLRDITYLYRFGATISYHAKGNVIYWGYDGIYPYRQFAEEISLATGYPLLESKNSDGGYKDWYTKVFQGLGLTIEVGNAALSYSELYREFKEILRQNEAVPYITAAAAMEIKSIWNHT